MGLSEEEWEKFNGILSHMGMTLIPIKKKTKIRKMVHKNSSRKGMKEIKKFEMQYQLQEGEMIKLWNV